MKVILLERVEGWGALGDVVNVKDGYARNFLLPRKLALPVTAGNKRQIELEKERANKLRALELAAAQTLKGEIETASLSVTKKVGENGHLFGSVTNAEVAELLRAKGFKVEKQTISLPHVKDLGLYTVHIKLYSGVTAEVKLEVKAESAE
jgi:large subunit ribosomal protein L9